MISILEQIVQKGYQQQYLPYVASWILKNQFDIKGFKVGHTDRANKMNPNINIYNDSIRTRGGVGAGGSPC